MKYVIESAFENMSIQKIMQLGLDANGRITNWTDSIEDVEELNSDYINEHYGVLQDEAYKRGFEDGKKASGNSCEGCQYEEAVGLRCRCCANRYPNQWTAKQNNDEIKVGDEVRTRDGAPSHTFLVTKVTDSHVYGISYDGSWNYWTKDEVTKTGKHYDIQSILEAIRA